MIRRKAEFLIGCVFVVTMVGSVNGGWNSLAKLVDNGYDNVLVAINGHVPENLEIIDNLKEAFTEASDYLYRATRQRAFFRKVDFLIPTTWQDRPEYEAVTVERFSRADYRVEEANPVWGDNPYTVQYGECGTPGKYVHLTPWFVLDPDNIVEYYWGNKGRVLIHEWGHQRYGLFDEYGQPDEDYPDYYIDSSGTLLPTACMKDPVGWNLNKNTYKPCRKNKKTGLYGKDCVFYPNLNKNTMPASIMFMQFLESVDKYCDDSTHNREAPNKHNAICQGQSTWSVILQHPDWVDNEPADVPSTIPSFRLLYPRYRKIVLVLDVSGSMSLKSRITKLRQAVYTFIMDEISLGIDVGCVTFSDTATIISWLTPINSDEDREEFLALVMPTLNADGNTAIGSGLLTGLQVLSQNQTESVEGSIMFLVTDGQENVPPYIDDVTDNIIESGVVVDTLAWGVFAEEKLETIASGTKGSSYYYSEQTQSNAHVEAFMEVASSSSSDSENDVPALLTSFGLELASEVTFTDSFYIDESIGANTRVTVTWARDENKTPVVVMVTSPDDVVIDELSPEYVRDKAIGRISIKLQGIAKIGLWKYTIFNPTSAPHELTLSISSGSRDGSGAITLTSWSGSEKVDFPSFQYIYAELKKGTVPVTGLTGVIAHVDRPRTEPLEVVLRDNGAGADVNKFDGIYSGSFVGFSRDGRYSFHVSVKTVGNANNDYTRTGSGARTINDTKAERDFEQMLNLESGLERTSTSKVFKVSDYDISDNTDYFPPIRISDLRVIEVSYENQTVTLTWTAPGGDLDHGTAEGYDLRYSHSYNELFDTFEQATPVDDSNVVEGRSLSDPQSSGETETIQITVPSHGDKVFYLFALRAYDDAGNYSSVSNIVSANLEFIDDIDEEPNESMNIGVLIVIVLLASMIAVVAGVVVIISKKNVLKKKKVGVEKEGDRLPIQDLKLQENVV
ncbi:calcium-activated chloride channel regulator 1-like [Saccoglossus kowalevskii]|uniref:Epithelial chloride channel protein-like n=1 Tax=Saccoglossus kowalevskii TaxID=10224 RepID=A0ABM0H094_SACKO|nr:PREDICTED: epithelial chloride channel protein-like [Saccoglossus kowalevskii]